MSFPADSYSFSFFEGWRSLLIPFFAGLLWLWSEVVHPQLIAGHCVSLQLKPVQMFECYFNIFRTHWSHTSVKSKCSLIIVSTLPTLKPILDGISDTLIWLNMSIRTSLWASEVIAPIIDTCTWQGCFPVMCIQPTKNFCWSLISSHFHLFSIP